MACWFGLYLILARGAKREAGNLTVERLFYIMDTVICLGGGRERSLR
jgi:hypothetical protein